MIGMLLLNASRQRERQARQQAENAFALAEERFRETRGVVDRFYTQVSEEVLLRQPGLQQVRRELLEMTLAHYQRFVEQRSDDRDLLQEVALTWYRIGSITEELQSPENSLEAYKRAEEIQRQISGSKDAAGIGARLSDTVNAIGRVEQKRGDLEAAGVAYQEATRLRQEAVTLRPDQTGLQRKLANSIMNSGLVLHLSGDERAGLELIKRAQERRWNQLASSDDVKLRRDLGMGEYNLAILVMADDPDAGEQHLLSAVDAFDRVLEKTPRDSMTEKNLASSHRLLADRYLALGRIKDAITHYRAAVSILETLTIRNPESVDFQVALASVQMNMAATDVSEGRTADAIARLESSIGLLDRLADSISSVPMYRRDLAAACNKLASLVEETDPERARAYRERALEILTRLNREYPENGLFQNDLESALEGSTNAF
jgi:tetratricopeptide (TPR) repeat protein